MYKKAWQAIENANSVVLVSHKNPDGDTIGSVLALYEVLQKSKKNVTIYNPSCKMPNRLGFLPNIKKIKDRFPDKASELIITCDCSSLDRASLDTKNTTIINIDHHKTNKHFGDINIVDESSPSNTMVVYKLLKENSIKITKSIAICLYTGFAEDTDFFTYKSIKEESLDAIKDFVKSGLDLSVVGLYLKQTSSLAQIRLKQYILNNFCLHENATIATIVITQKALKQTGCSQSDTKNIIKIILELATVKIAIMVLEKESKGAKISLRSKGDIDVSDVALMYGGGGHKNAAGFETNDFKPDKTIKQIVEKLKDRKDS